MDHSYIDKNLADIKGKIAQRCASSGIDEGAHTLMAAVKSADAGEINHLCHTLGIKDIGENRVQQLLEHYPLLENPEELRLHFIGTLQTNKVKYIVDKVDMIQSLDSLRLAEEINRRCEKIGKVMDVLIEINCGHEENKSGIMPEDTKDFALLLKGFKNLNLCGFMTMAPVCDTEEKYRKYFSATRELAKDIWQNALGRTDDLVLSMGMSDSYLPAVSEGATLIRLGRGLFKKPENIQ